MTPLISWILFLGFSGTVYIALKGVPCLRFSLEDKTRSDRIEGEILGQKVRKKRRLALDKVLLEETVAKSRNVCVRENTSQIEEDPNTISKQPLYASKPLARGPKSPMYASLYASLDDENGMELSESKKHEEFSSAKKSVESGTFKQLMDNDNVKTKKQKQNAVKREKQKLLKARIEEERLRNYRVHQKTLEEERLKALVRQASSSAWNSQPESGEWIVVGGKGNRHATSVFATTAG
ncbi:hypothetical protein PNEG_01166 [Pneumocystis murina B123]|uniref:Uncharacterized protein n=1 Tax=Pneumocystis murina (strain B123) TaxID=1069680 RepID=M7NTM1_PNEMU|nr:hypothetical protein PNEG_01166 [Pneumocystis murina B123]EMR10451.1 hypothetical protein PNEG_01166 [Pneumocystis murina B123]